MKKMHPDPGRQIPKKALLPGSKGLPLNMAIVGGGRACKFILELLANDSFPQLHINILAVCDINPEAKGLLLAQKMGIRTTHDLHDLFKIEALDSILELTGSDEVLLEIIRLRPKRVGVLEYNISRMFRRFFEMSQRLASKEKELISEKMFSNFLIQQSTAAIVILKPDFTILDANEAYLNTVKRTKENVIGAKCHEISHGVAVPCSSAFPGVKCPMVETLRTGKNVHLIHDHQGPDGNPMYCDLTTYPVKNDEGEVIQIIELWRDITHEFSNRWEKKVLELKSDIQKLVQEDRMISLGKLSASCAHEINNPIQGLITFSHLMIDILEQGAPSPEDLTQFKSHLKLMSTELERCGDIVSGLLSFSRETRVVYKSVDLNEVINATLSLTRHKLELAGIALKTDLSAKPLMLEGDINQLQQCFLNLIFNAIEAMPGKGDLSVTLKPGKAKKTAVVEIRDTGFGIPEENMDSLFDPFFTTKDIGQGTGLGLSIVYGVVKNHQGTIKIDSKEGKGTLFTLTFPIQ